MPQFLSFWDTYLVVKWCAPFMTKASASNNVGRYVGKPIGIKINIIAKMANINCSAPRIFLSMYVPPWLNECFDI